MPQNSATMGNNGRMVAEKYFRWDIASECLDDIYKKVISNSK
jgi:hypothetical protein